MYQQIVAIPMGTNCAPLIADLFLYCYERDFKSKPHKSKQYDLIDMFNDTSRYLDDIFTIDNPEFEKHIPDIYPIYSVQGLITSEGAKRRFFTTSQWFRNIGKI